MGNKAVDAKIAERMANINLQAKQREKAERALCGLAEPGHLYDIGRSRETNFDPHEHSDRFFNVYEARKREKRRGTHRTASQDIGEGAWAVKHGPVNGRSQATKSFLTRGHIEVHDI